MTLNPVVTGVLDNVLGSPLVARDHDPMGGVMDEIPRWDNPVTGQFEPIPGHQTEVAMEDWRKPYVQKWIKHHNPKDPFFIKDKEYLKNLQDIVIFHRPV